MLAVTVQTDLLFSILPTVLCLEYDLSILEEMFHSSLELEFVIKGSNIEIETSELWR